jgi:dynein heavy chain
VELDTTFLKRNLTPNDEIRKKVVQLFDTVRVRHGLMLVGAAMGGKTEITNCLAQSLTRM